MGWTGTGEREEMVKNSAQFPLTPALPALARRERGKTGRLLGAMATVVGGMICAGCSSSRPSTTSLVQSPVYAIPAQQLVGEVQKVVGAPPISLAVENQGNGALLTGWQEPFQGDFHIVRYWHERTRYHITVVPDFADPAHRSRLQVTDESEQRPDEGGINAEAQKWHPAPGTHRPERSETLLHLIEAALQAPAATRPGA